MRAELPDMSYANLRRLAPANGRDRVIGSNTKVCLSEGGTVDVKLHGYVIARLSPDKVIVNNHGYHTLVTSERINRVVDAATRGTRKVAIRNRAMRMLDENGTIVMTLDGPIPVPYGPQPPVVKGSKR